jgi:hypothetical protein
MSPLERMRRVMDDPVTPYREQLLIRARSGGSRPVDRMLRAMLDGHAFESARSGQPGRASDSTNRRSGSV